MFDKDNIDYTVLIEMDINVPFCFNGRIRLGGLEIIKNEF
jgi:hypothetical protein